MSAHFFHNKTPKQKGKQTTQKSMTKQTLQQPTKKQQAKNYLSETLKQGQDKILSYLKLIVY